MKTRLYIYIQYHSMYMIMTVN